MYVTTAQSRTVVHAHRDCQRLQEAKGIREATRWEREQYPECSICVTGFTHEGGSRAAYNALVDASEQR